MGQIKKVHIEKKILSTAKFLFIKHGYLSTNLRSIAKNAKVTLSNLYNYYPDKNALFTAVLQPVLDDLERLCIFARTHRVESSPFETLEEKRKYVLIALEYIQLHKNELNLLFNKSQGSSLENFSDYLARQYEENWNHLFVDLKHKFPNKKLKKPSSFFLRAMAHFHLMTISKILLNDFSQREIISIADEFSKFLWHGGLGLITQ